MGVPVCQEMIQIALSGPFCVSSSSHVALTFERMHLSHNALSLAENDDKRPNG